jgi:geranylgeranyl diphosphate synthase, type II
MIENGLSLEVPGIKEIRQNIRKEVKEWFLNKEFIPPVSFHDLSVCADILIEKHDWNRDLKAFIMVCCGNSVWRQVVGVVPYNRRILLLPHCLRSSSKCIGQHDEMGLLCGECGNCDLMNLLRESESLGYFAIVTEGTSIAARLIESGKVDAVIGVGCLDVLQKMFASVNKYSVPGIGIPLLTCGCTDTKADLEWIMEEILHIDNNPSFRLLNLNYLRKRTNSIFEKAQVKNILGKAANSTEELVFESILAGGKRLRPLLTLLAYEAFSDQADSIIINKLAVSIECFHKASLIHDDIEDNDSKRYGKQTLHAQFGIPVAINAGDLLIGEGYRLIAETSLPAEVILDCIKVVSGGHRQLAVGQGIELMARKNHEVLSLEQILRVFEYKTATAFRVSLLLGAVAGNADSQTIALLEELSISIGIAYQIKDDLDDFKIADCQLDFYGPSILISLLNEKLTEADSISFMKAWNGNDNAVVRHLVDLYNIHPVAESMLKDYIKKSENCLADLKNIGLKMALHEILGNTFKDYL